MIQVWNNFLLEQETKLFEMAVHDKNIMEGPVLQEFQNRLQKILNTKHVIGTASGSAALALALMSIGVGAGDEVIVPDLTFIATANAACLLGAKVVLAPTQKDKPLLDLDKVESLITEQTKAIVTVDLNGRISCSKELKERYSPRGIYIIDDACQALMSGEENRLAGTQADIGCFSFGITKTVSTVQGGLVITDDDQLYERMRIIKTQGMKSVFEGDAYYYPGFNFKLPDVLAAIGMGQINRLEAKIEHMKRIDNLYREGLSEVRGVSFFKREENEFLWMTDILCEDRDRVRNVLYENGIISRPLGAPLHTAPFLQSVGDYTESEILQNKILYLPSGPDQDIKNVEKVIEVLTSSNLEKIET